MVNKVILVGRLGKDPEMRYTTGGQAVCNFSLATDESYKNRAGEKQQKTEWHSIKVWGKLAEICSQYLKKGSLIFISGKIGTESWEKDGEKKSKTVITASEMKMLSGKGEHNEGTQKPQAEEEHASEQQITDDDIPF